MYIYVVCINICTHCYTVQLHNNITNHTTSILTCICVACCIIHSHAFELTRLWQRSSHTYEHTQSNQLVYDNIHTPYHDHSSNSHIGWLTPTHYTLIIVLCVSINNHAAWLYTQLCHFHKSTHLWTTTRCNQHHIPTHNSPHLCHTPTHTHNQPQTTMYMHMFISTSDTYKPHIVNTNVHTHSYHTHATSTHIQCYTTQLVYSHVITLTHAALITPLPPNNSQHTYTLINSTTD